MEAPQQTRPGEVVVISRPCPSVQRSLTGFTLPVCQLHQQKVTAGYAMSRWAFPGRDTGLRVFLITQMFPGVVMAIPLYILLDEMGLLDSLLGLSLVYATTAIPSYR